MTGMRILNLVCATAAAVALYALSAVLLTRSALLGLKMTGRVMKWEIKTAVGRVNLVFIVLSFLLILHLPVFAFLLEFLNIVQDGPQAATLRGYTSSIAYVTFSLSALGSLLFTAWSERRRQLGSSGPSP